MADTLLVISGPGVPPYSARGLKQSLEPIAAAANLRRTVNGELLDLSAPQFRKYKSTISCEDQDTPAIDRIWPGSEITIDCVAELAYPTATGTPGRTVVSGSERTEGDHTFYRPRITFRITNYTAERDEYGATVSWQLELEEV